MIKIDEKIGIELGEEQTTLLQKVKEKMTYIIRQGKNIEAQNKRIIEQGNRTTDFEANTNK